MSVEAVASLLQRVEGDERFAGALDALAKDPAALLARVRQEGFDVTADEVRGVLVEALSGRIDPELLDRLAAGADWGPGGGGASVSAVTPPSGWQTS